MNFIRRVTHPQLGQLVLELRVSRMLIYASWLGGGLFLLWAALLVSLGVATRDPEIGLAALLPALLGGPWLLFARWMQRNEIECYDDGILTRRMFGSRQLRFDQMRSCHSELTRKTSRSLQSGQPVTRYTRHLHFTSADEARHPSIHYQTNWYYNDPRLLLILAWCSRQTKTDAEASERIDGDDRAADGWTARGG